MDDDRFARISRKVLAARNKKISRDKEMNRVRQVRRGRLHELFPQEFADDMERSIAPNTIDTMARDQAEMFAPLPAINCYSKNMATEADEKRAMERNKAAAYYWEKSHLALQNVDFCDSCNSYSFGVYIVEPDFGETCPKIRWESSFNSYYGKSRYGDTQWYAKVKKYTESELCDMFPEYAGVIKKDYYGDGTTELELIQFVDHAEYITYLPARENLVLLRVGNKLDRCPVVIAERPDQESDPRGQFDDVVWPTLASALMQLYMLKAAYQAVNAPFDVPSEVTEIPFGPDAVIPNDSPKQIRRIGLDIPGETFALTGQLDRNIKEGARYPEARTGGVQGNIITGKGVEALMGTMDTQIMTMQRVIGLALEQVTELCFQVELAYWPDLRKTIHGTYSGRPYQLTYTPSKTFSDTTGVKVSYGFASGMNPSNAMVAMLQLLGGGIVSRDTVRLNLPFDIDIAQEQMAIDTQEMNDGLKQGFLASLQAMSVLVTQGQDPRQLLLSASKAIELRQKGKALHEAIAEAFEPPEPTPEEQALAEAGPPGSPGAGPDGLPPGMGPAGRMQGVPPGQAGRPPGGMPNVQSLLSSLRGGGADPRMEVSTIRKTGIGT